MRRIFLSKLRKPRDLSLEKWFVASQFANPTFSEREFRSKSSNSRIGDLGYTDCVYLTPNCFKNSVGAGGPAAHLTRSTNNNRHLQKFDHIRRFSSIAGIDTPSAHKSVNGLNDVKFPCRSLFYNDNSHIVQTRRFLGCGDGQEGGVLSKVYEEKRVLGYSPEQLFNVVAAVDLYHGFVPWCQRSEIVKQNPDGSFDAELEIGFKFLVESYVSHVELNRPKSIKTTVSESTLFDHLINIWEFNPGPVPGSCNLYFLVDFKFNSPLYRQVASVFFKEVVSQLVGSFSERCRLIYGPGVPILENSYG